MIRMCVEFTMTYYSYKSLAMFRGCSDIYATRCNVTQFIYFWKPLYMFRVVSPPTIRSTYNCIYSIWHLWRRWYVASCWIYIRTSPKYF